MIPVISVCMCSFEKRLLGSGCKFCQPEEYIKVLEDAIEEQQEYIKELEYENERLLSLFQDCKDILKRIEE